MDVDNNFVPKVHFELIPIKNLVSNQDYQRNLSEGHILRAARHFDPYQINPVKVSRRDGINYVFNGQHTIEIVALVSGSRETPVWCMIYDDLTYEHEADIFANQQRYVKNLQPYEVFIANVEARNPQEMMILELVGSYHLTIGTKKGPNVICAVSTLESIYEKYGYQILDAVLRLVVATWEGDPLSFSSNILNAMARVVVTYGSHLDEEVFKEKLGVLSVKQMIRNAKDRRSGSMGVAEVMVLTYNGKRRSGSLPIRSLYSNSVNIIEDMEEEDAETEEPEDSQEPQEEICEAEPVQLALTS